MLEAAQDSLLTSTTLSLVALAISALALLVSSVNAWVNYQNRRDKTAMAFTFAPKSIVTGSINELAISRLDWTLHNGSERTISNPTVTVDPGSGGPPLYFEGTGTIPGGNALDLIPIGHAPTSIPDWYSAKITATVTVGGRRRRVDVTFRQHH
ncbi:hypothetical protein [Leifsonia aquatica]|uniref:hypothetical protein n=1 Tax=Leifsonia aquatica TaxID=144185 RepID=UPI0038159374